MAKEKILKPIEVLIDSYGIQDSLKVFLTKLSQDFTITNEDIEELLDEGLEAFAKFKLVMFEADNQARLLENITASFPQLSDKESLFFDEFKAVFLKSYNTKISKFFNELVLVSLSLVVPTLVQLYVIDKFSILSAVWLTIPITLFSVLKESNILEFFSVSNKYKPTIFKGYFANLFSTRNKFLAVVLFPFYLLKWLLSFLHSFIFQYKFQVLFYMAVGILLTIGYHHVKDVIDDFVPKTEQTESSKDKEKKTTASEKSVDKTLEIKSLKTAKTVKIIEEPSVDFDGELSEASPSQTFQYTTAHDGIFRLEFIDLKADISLYIDVKDATGKSVKTFSETGGLIKLGANQTYDITVKRSRTDTPFKLRLFVPKTPQDITATQLVDDQAAFVGQVNRYVYVAENSGSYRFDLTNSNENTGFKMYVLNKLDETLESSSTKGVTVTLEKGETYQLLVEHDTNKALGTYRLTIGEPKVTEDISGYTAVKDSIDYIDQVNTYKFTPKISGFYGFFVTEKLADVEVNLLVSDQYGKIVMGNSYEKSTSGTVWLEKDSSYQVQVIQKYDFSSYTLKVGSARDSVDISKTGRIEDEFKFNGEVVFYTFTANETKNYLISKTGDINTTIYNKFNEELTSYSNEVELTKGEEYTIKVTQGYNQAGKYQLSIE